MLQLDFIASRIRKNRRNRGLGFEGLGGRGTEMVTGSNPFADVREFELCHILEHLILVRAVRLMREGIIYNPCWLDGPSRVDILL